MNSKSMQLSLAAGTLLVGMGVFQSAAVGAIAGGQAAQADPHAEGRTQRALSRRLDAILAARKTLDDDAKARAELDAEIDRVRTLMEGAEPGHEALADARLIELLDRAADRIEAGGNKYRARAVAGYATMLLEPAVSAGGTIELSGGETAEVIPVATRSFVEERLEELGVELEIAKKERATILARLDATSPQSTRDLRDELERNNRELVELADRLNERDATLNRAVRQLEEKLHSIQAAQRGPVSLFNAKDLDGWKIFTSDKTDQSLTWRVADGKIICTGEPRGYIMTESEYDNFHLTLEWRWPGEPGNSGVLLRTIGEDKIWPSCLEAQLMHNRAGDFWKIGEIEATTDAERHTANGRNTRHVVNAEKPLGEWNRYDIFFQDEHVTLVVNGQFVNSATAVSQRKGRICLQSEGVPIEFRRIRITPLD